MKPEKLTYSELIASILNELERVNGKDYAEACLIKSGERRNTWCYLYYPRLNAGRWIPSPVSIPVRMRDLEKLLAELRSMHEGNNLAETEGYGPRQTTSSPMG